MSADELQPSGGDFNTLDRGCEDIVVDGDSAPTVPGAEHSQRVEAVVVPKYEYIKCQSFVVDQSNTDTGPPSQAENESKAINQGMDSSDSFQPITEDGSQIENKFDAGIAHDTLKDSTEPSIQPGENSVTEIVPLPDLSSLSEDMAQEILEIRDQVSEAESGIDISRDSQWEDTLGAQNDSSPESTPRSSFKKSSSSMKSSDSFEVLPSTVEQGMKVSQDDRVDQSDKADTEETQTKEKAAKKGFSFTGYFKKKVKSTTVVPKESPSEEATTPEPQGATERRSSRTSLLSLISSDTSPSTEQKSSVGAPQVNDTNSVVSVSKDPDPAVSGAESPTKSFFSFSGVLRRKPKKAEPGKSPDNSDDRKSLSEAEKPPRPPPPVIQREQTPSGNPFEDEEEALGPKDSDLDEDDDLEGALAEDFLSSENERGCLSEDQQRMQDLGYEDIDVCAEGETYQERVPEEDTVSVKEKNKRRMFSLPQYFKRMSKAGDSKKFKTQIWSSVVTIVLVKGRDLLPMDDNGYSDPYVKFRLGNERYKSKYKAKTLSPKWLEQFDLRMFDDQTSHLEISVWDHDTGGRDDIMGRAEIDLQNLDPEKTHDLDVALEDGAGIINILLSNSGTSGSETISDLANFNPSPADKEKVVRKYSGVNSFKGIKDIGWLQVKVMQAQGLTAADIGGKSDPYCVLELVNSRLQTQTEYKTLNPEWGKVFSFNVKDIHSVLEVTVYDEDRDKKSEFLGKVSIPLLRVRNGERRWYQVKDRKLVHRTKGAIQLELEVVFNHFKAAIRTFNPREDKYMQPDPKFKLSVMKRNIDRVSKIAESGVEAGKFLQSCFDWESKPRSIIAFSVFLIVNWTFELYMLPLTLLIVFVKNLLVVHIVGNLMKDKDLDEYVDEDDDEDEEEKEMAKQQQKKEEKKSFKEKLQAIQDVCLQVQEGMDMAASMGERVKNTFNWTVPWLSWLAVILLSIGVFVLYYIPVRYLIMAFGINKFTKKLRAPNAIPNNELLDYLSRVPSDKELIMYRELRPDSNIGTTKKKRS